MPQELKNKIEIQFGALKLSLNIELELDGLGPMLRRLKSLSNAPPARRIYRGLKRRFSTAASKVGVSPNAPPGAPEATAPGEPPAVVAKRNAELDRAEELLTKLERENAALHARISEGDGKSEGVRAENVVWIFGSARTGSTWLSDMMGDLENAGVWNEPLVGNLFGYFFYDRSRYERRQHAKNFIFTRAHKGVWLNSIRRFVLDSASARFPEAGEKGRVVVKEPNGSVGAPLLAEALPESRLVFLIRDFRDTVSSIKEANTEGGWLHGGRERQGFPTGLATRDPEGFIKVRVNTYMLQAGNAKKAYDAHTGPKTLVKYEDLRENTLETMKRIYSELDIPVDGGELARVVEAHAWENIPEDEKGEGKRNRKAKPGGWREDLTPEEARLVEETTAPLMKQFYPDYPEPKHTI